MSDFSDLAVGLSGLEAQQVGLDTVGQNVANASTPGYVEEQVQLGAVGSVQHPGFDESASQMPGDGVEVAGVQRLSNTYLQQRSFTEQGNQGLLSAQQTGLQAVQENFPEPSTTGISAQLTQFWQDWSTLANNPSDAATRSTLVEDATSLTSSLNQTSTSLSTLSQQTVQSITSTLTQVNRETGQIASLNQQILAGSGSGANASANVNELEDQRDELISQLSNQIGVNVTYNSDGTAEVNAGSEALVSGVTSQTLSLATGGPPYSLLSGQDGSTFQPTSGELAGSLSVVNQYVPGYQASLDQVAQSLMGSVNHLMSTGYDLNGNQGSPFFLGTGASDIKVNPAVAADPSRIAAASAPDAFGLVGYQRGREHRRRGRRATQFGHGDDRGAVGRMVERSVELFVVGLDHGHGPRGRRRLQPARDRGGPGHFDGQQQPDQPAGGDDQRQFGLAVRHWRQHGPGNDQHGDVPERL